jgi:hypothetical protein
MTALPAIPASAQQTLAARARPTTRPAAEVLAQIGRDAGVIVLADSTVQARLAVSGSRATPDTVERQIAQAVAELPAGTTWVKLYVPAPKNDRWVADDVTAYARSLTRLVGTIGRPSPEGTVEIMGRQVPADKADEYAAGLDLKVVYLVTNSRASATPNALSNWTLLTPDERSAYAQQQAQRIMTLDPATRLETMRQLMRNQEPNPQAMIMRMVMKEMTEDERVQLKMSLADERKVDVAK